VHGLLQGGTNSPVLVFERFYGVGTIDIAEAVDWRRRGVEVADGISQEELGSIEAPCDIDAEGCRSGDPGRRLRRSESQDRG
jgi:hypothetical protein